MIIRRIALTLAKALLIAVSLVALILGAFFYGAPPLLTAQLPRLIHQHAGRTATVAAIKLQLSPLALAIDNFEAREKNGEPFAGFERLIVQLDARASFKQSTLIIKHILLQKPVLHIIRQADGRFNFQDLQPTKTDAAADKGGALPISIARLSVTEGKLGWQDAQAKNQAEELQSLQFEAENITVNAAKPIPIELDFSLKSGGHVNWRGEVGINPLASGGHLKLERLNLNKWLGAFAPPAPPLHIGADNTLNADYQFNTTDGSLKLSVHNATLDLHDLAYSPSGQLFKLADLRHETDLLLTYARGHWQLEAKSAKVHLGGLRGGDKLLANLDELNAQATYQLAYANNKLQAALNHGQVSIKALKLSDQSQPLATFPAIAAQGIDADTDKHQLNVGALTLDDADVAAWLNPDGTVNYQRLLAAAGQNNNKMVGADTPATSWQIQVGSVAVNNGTVNFDDRTLAKPARFSFKPINLTLTGYSNAPASRLPFALRVGFNNNGGVDLRGEVSTAPLAMQATVAATHIELEKFQPYYDKFIRLDMIDGVLGVDGRLELAQNPAGQWGVKFNGDSTITDLLIRDQRVHKDFLKWERLTLTNMAVDASANRYTAAALALNKPYARVTIRKDKTVNFSNLLLDTAKPATKTVTASNSAPQTAPYLKLGKIQIIDGSSDFTDLSLILPFSAHIKSLDGGASGVSSDKNSPIKVALKGDAYDLAPVDITGVISPYLGEYQTEVNFNGLPMPLVSSYMVQFAGYKVEKGKMTLNLNYHIANKKLTASNHFLIDQFELGERVDNPDAVSLPLKMAVAVLKDSNGKIKIDVPISGDLDNPRFNIGAIVTDALFNTISKVISSPFALLGTLAGASHTDLSTIEFKPGSAALDANQQLKLAQIAAALQNRRQLSLEIKGVTQQEQDWPAISDDALYDQLKIRRAAQINKEATRKIRAEYVELSNADYRQGLADLFIEKFPSLAEKPLFGTPRLKNTAGGDFYDIAKQKLQEIIQPEQERLKELANDRAQAIANAIVQKGGIAQERVYILDSVVNVDKGKKVIASVLSLKAD
jgi:outer membrane protein OmpA-like peptidoglycan-associated protein